MIWKWVNRKVVAMEHLMVLHRNKKGMEEMEETRNIILSMQGIVKEYQCCR